MSFEERLLTQLKAEVSERAERGGAATDRRTTTRRVLAAAAVAGIVAAGVGVLPTLTGAEPAAYAVTTNPDGTVTAWLADLSDLEQLEAELARRGVPTDIAAVAGGTVCLDDPHGPVGPHEMETKPSGHIFVDIDYDIGGPATPGTLFTVDPQQFQPGEVLLVRLRSDLPRAPIGLALVDGPVPACTPVDDPRYP